MGEFAFSTQNLGTTSFIFLCVYLLYRFYKNNKDVFFGDSDDKIDYKNLKQCGIVLIVGWVLIMLYNPIKTTQPKMSDIEYRESTPMVVPERIQVKTESLEDKQNKLASKVDNKIKNKIK